MATFKQSPVKRPAKVTALPGFGFVPWVKATFKQSPVKRPEKVTTLPGFGFVPWVKATFENLVKRIHLENIRTPRRSWREAMPTPRPYNQRKARKLARQTGRY